MSYRGGWLVWLDLSNSPHIPLFRPIVDSLEALGVRIMITARDFSQTVELARQTFDSVTVVGGWGRGTVAKSANTMTRALELTRVAHRRHPHLALSHNSYSQLIAARALRIPAVTMMDYEHQPANHLAFRLASVVIVPQIYPEDVLRRQGARRVHRYEGFKEQAYLGPGPSSGAVREALGVDGEILAVLRPPPDFAAYHRFDNPLFPQAIDHLLTHPGAVGAMLPRTPSQVSWVAERWGDRVRVPPRSLPGMDLLWEADLMIGAGGTMNREAALLGTPTYTLFAGAPSAVDQMLIDGGMMTRIADTADLNRLAVERKPVRAWLPPGNADKAPAVQATVDSVLRELSRR